MNVSPLLCVFWKGRTLSRALCVVEKNETTPALFVYIKKEMTLPLFLRNESGSSWRVCI